MSNPLEHLLIRASAGTGKTFQLSNRYISLLSCGVSPTDILATTFTRKAAGEIRDRILERLSDAVLDPTSSEELSSHLSFPDQIEPLSFESCFQAMVSDLHRLNIGTLDSFFSVWTTKLALEYGLTPGWSILSTTEYDNLVQTAISDLVQYGNTADLSRLLILLNKGSVSRSVTENVRESIKDLRDLFLRSDEDVWKQSLTSARLKDGFLDDALLELETAANGLEKPGLVKGVLADIELLRIRDFTAAIDKGLLKKIILREDTYNRIEIPSSLSALYQPILEYLANYFALEILHQSGATYDLLSRFTKRLNDLKRQVNRLEFSDATEFAARLDELPQELVFRLNSNIQHVLLDEFQDTSIPQWRAISHLVNEVTGKAGSPQQSLFCVGDTKQAIYGWRGGRREIFDTLSNNVEQIGTRKLKHSYRSSEFVLQFINKVFNNLSNHPRLGELSPVLTQWSTQYEDHSAAKDLDGYVVYMNAEGGSKDTERLKSCLRKTVEQVRLLLETEKSISIGVLLRTNSDIGELIQMLASEGIVASEEGGNTLTRFSPIQLLCNWLHLLEFPNDSLAYFQLQHSPLASRLDHTSNQNCLPAERLTRERDHLLEIGLGNYIDELKQALMPYLTTTQQFRVQQLIRHAETFESENPLRLTEFLSSLDNEHFTEESASTVRVMTIHSSKGLEFDAVILPDLGRALLRTPNIVVSRDGEQLPASVFPYRNSQVQMLLPQRYRDTVLETRTEGLEEVLCVLYVAMTRAAHALYLIGPAHTKSPKDTPLTLAGLIQQAINGSYDSSANTVLFENGHSDWYAKHDNTIDLVDDRPQMPDGLNRVAENVSHTLPTASPSSLEGGEYFRASVLLRAPNQDALDFGTLVHQLFEGIVWWDATKVDDYLDELTRRKLPWDNSLRGTLDAFSKFNGCTEVLTQTFLQSLPSFAESDQLSVKAEVPVTSIVDGYLIRGFIDRLVVGYREGRIVAADIVDYKTDELGNDNALLEERVRHYRPQLIAYKTTIAQMLKLDISMVSARLLFVTAGVHVDLDMI